ncbi:MAG: diacylglycerol kinase [Nitrosomonadales bacterium]|nr:diacylglycerol kinase [Nitrosomonadales bacterium]
METPHKHPRGIKHVWHAVLTAMVGLRAAWRHEDAFRQEVFVAVIAIPVALFSPAPSVGKALMIACVLLVIIAELFNSAIEAAVDHTSIEIHPLARRAKDIATAAVLLSIINAAIVWGLVLFF